VFAGQEINVEADIVYDEAKKNITVNKSVLGLGSSEFASNRGVSIQAERTSLT